MGLLNFEFLFELLKKDSRLSFEALKFKSNTHLIFFLILSSRAKEGLALEISNKLICKYKSLDAVLNSSLKSIEEDIKKIGFYKIKAEYIIEASKLVIKDYNSKIPEKFEELIKIPGIGRKNAMKFLSLVKNENFHLLFDSHFIRVIKRIGYCNSDFKYLEKEIKQSLKDCSLTHFSNLITNLGKQICHKFKPKCSSCCVAKICQFNLKKR